MSVGKGQPHGKLVSGGRTKHRALCAARARQQGALPPLAREPCMVHGSHRSGTTENPRPPRKALVSPKFRVRAIPIGSDIWVEFYVGLGLRWDGPRHSVHSL
ncbi:uncharacterized protein Aud_003832 [Aspergillus udagawae]|uniref:Uncharacterized protein n=1 Tax=Aspergillus udagawae TaxID=91492 RepID=A0A8E0UXF7_9EURO|nr:uncharacterized protein Aud_003832 [Aspergillus udagawae]GIC87448.1 hypothetical protein Aud_003832 [Aspergillus udagawae]